MINLLFFVLIAWTCLLPYFEELLPVRVILIEPVQTAPNERVAKETEAYTHCGHLHEHCGCSEQRYGKSWNENSS